MENRDVGQQQQQQENMAEAAVENPAAKFFCHRCTQEISPVLPDYICPRCQSGFIEELVQGPPETSEEPEEEFNPLNQIADLWSMLHYLRTPDDPLLTQSTTAEVRERASRPGPSRRARLSRIPQVPNVRRNYADDTTRTRTEGFLHLVNVLYGTGTVTNTSLPEFLNLHSNPGDYAWGRGGWNAIINQLINQLDVTGPPPLPKDKINEIPTVEISQDQVDKNLQCTVCMEDFKFSEPVRRLQCDHHFHNDCIIPWLELHGTCPICRKLLNDSQDSFVGSSIPETFMTARENIENVPMSNNDDVSTARLSNVPRQFSPHQSSVYDFTDEFD